MLFCLQHLPWHQGPGKVKVEKCEIHFPPNSHARISMGVELLFAKYKASGEYPIDILIDGHGSHIKGSSKSRLFATKSPEVNVTYAPEDKILPLTASKFEIRNLSISSFKGNPYGILLL